MVSHLQHTSPRLATPHTVSQLVPHCCSIVKAPLKTRRSADLAIRCMRLVLAADFGFDFVVFFLFRGTPVPKEGYENKVFYVW